MSHKRNVYTPPAGRSEIGNNVSTPSELRERHTVVRYQDGRLLNSWPAARRPSVKPAVSVLHTQLACRYVADMTDTVGTCAHAQATFRFRWRVFRACAVNGRWCDSHSTIRVRSCRQLSPSRLSILTALLLKPATSNNDVMPSIILSSPPLWNRIHLSATWWVNFWVPASNDTRCYDDRQGPCRSQLRSVPWRTLTQAATSQWPTYSDQSTCILSADNVKSSSMSFAVTERVTVWS